MTDGWTDERTDGRTNRRMTTFIRQLRYDIDLFARNKYSLLTIEQPVLTNS